MLAMIQIPAAGVSGSRVEHMSKGNLSDVRTAYMGIVYRVGDTPRSLQALSTIPLSIYYNRIKGQLEYGKSKIHQRDIKQLKWS
jgi:hypothetical protein